MLIYIASDFFLSTIDWDENDPKFYVQREQEADIKKKFTKQNIYYIGSSQGCGCGFGYEDEFGLTYPAQAGQKEGIVESDDLHRLRDYITKAAETGELELFSYWDGEEWEEKSRISVTPDYFGQDAFWVKKGEFMTINKVRNG